MKRRYLTMICRLAGRTIGTIIILVAFYATPSLAQKISRLPYALPKTTLTFNGSLDTIPFQTIIQHGRPLELRKFGRIRYVKIDLNRDKTDEWIVASREFPNMGPESIHICVVRDGELIEIGRVYQYFTIIQREHTFPDIEYWHVSGEFTSRHRISYDEESMRYKALYVDMFMHHELEKTIVYK